MPVNITFTRLVSLLMVLLVLFLYLINSINVETSINISKKSLEKKITNNETQLDSLTNQQNVDLSKEINVKQNAGIIIPVNTLKSQKISDFISQNNQNDSQENSILKVR
jgi:hypothetical protein